MIVSLVALLLSPKIQFPGGAQTTLIVLRLIHLVAGITWVGLLYFFNLVNVPFLQELDAKSRGMVVPKLMPRALWWFRWSSVVTVLAGIAYWMHIVASDARNAVALGEPASAGMMFGSFFGLWTLAFAIEMEALMSPVVAIGIGGGLGWFMMLNVWGVVWRMQKKMIRWTEANASQGTAMPPEAPS